MCLVIQDPAVFYSGACGDTSELNREEPGLVCLNKSKSVVNLQVWYAASYAEFVNQKIHDVTEEERKGDGDCVAGFYDVISNTGVAEG